MDKIKNHRTDVSVSSYPPNDNGGTYEPLAPDHDSDNCHEHLTTSSDLNGNNGPIGQDTISNDEGSDDNEDNILSVDESVELLGFGRFQYRVLIASGLCFAADSSQVVLLSFLTPILKDEWKLSTEEAAGLTSAVFAGAMFGTLILGPLSDKIGRRPVFLLAAFIIMIAGLATAVSPNYETVIVAIFLVGSGIGGVTVPFDIFAEFLPASDRGTNLLKIEYAWTMGGLYVVALTYFLLQQSKPSWRLVTALTVCPCALSFVVGYIFVPESPHWLASVGRTDEAMRVLRNAATINGRDATFVFPETMVLQRLHEHKQASIADLFVPRWREITLRLWGGWSASAFGYYGALLITTRVFHETKSESATATESFDYGAILVSCLAELVGTTMAINAVDRVGRIRSQIVSYALAGALLCVLCITAEWGISRLALIAISFGARVFEMSGTCVTWVCTAEVLSTEIRGTGHSTANAMARLGAFFCPFLVESKIQLIHVGLVMLVVHIFTVLCLSKLPETTGRGMGEGSERASASDPDPALPTESDNETVRSFEFT